MFHRFWAIAKNAYDEIIRQPVYGILLLVGILMISGSLLIAGFVMLEDDKLVADMGLGTMMMLGIVLAVLSCACVVSREIDAKTAGATLSKPVGRVTFVLGKTLGVSAAMWTACYLWTLVLMLTLRIGVASTARYELDWAGFIGFWAPLLLAAGFGMWANYFYRWNFTSTAIMAAVPLYTLSVVLLLFVGAGWRFETEIGLSFFNSAEGKHGLQVLQAAVLVGLGVWVMSTVAMAASTRMNVVPAVLICAAVFFVGMIAQYLYAALLDLPAKMPLAAETAAMVKKVWGPMCDGLYRAVPSLQVFWVADQLVRPEPYIPMSYVAQAAVYAVFWCLTMTALSVFLFERREIV